MDKELVRHDLQEYESLIKYYMVPGLEKLNRLPGQKFLNPKMMNETKSGEEKKQNLVSKS